MFLKDKITGAVALPYYHLYEMNYAAITPMRMINSFTQSILTSPLNIFSQTPPALFAKAQAALFERATRRYEKPSFGLSNTVVEGVTYDIREERPLKKSFCQLIHFKREGLKLKQPKALIVAPMSGHYATLLRNTVEAFIPSHEVYITDWQDARDVPLKDGAFNLDTYIDYVQEFIRFVGEGVHVMAICQPSVPVLCAIARMEEAKEPIVPKTMTLMGGPMDTRLHPTVVNVLAHDKGLNWFKTKVISQVPAPYKGAGREVYPGFIQLTGFIQMNLQNHIDAHKNLYENIAKGDNEAAVKTEKFYDEYMAVMDLTAEFYLQTIEKVFINHDLAKGTMTHYDALVKPESITRVALMTVEGENDDITGAGQTEITHKLCTNIPDTKRLHYTQAGVGHYGVFSGSRFRSEIAPRIKKFMSDME
jgi:poly(3-hydroxybutyrate) depolymerase